MVNEAIINSVRKYLKILGTENILANFAVIFGSQTNGMADEWSDIDLLVVSPTYDKPPDRNDVIKLWRIAAKVDSRIEPIPCGLMEWEEEGVDAVVDAAKREGTVVRFE